MKRKKANLSLDRDVSWMFFNHRILEEAKKSTVPLLERISFLGIYSNNLDEFFRVRVASLRRFLEYVNGKREERKSVKAALGEIYALNRKYSAEYGEVLEAVRASLKRNGFRVLRENTLDEAGRRFVHEFYYNHLCGYVLPVWFSSLTELCSAADDQVHLVIRADDRFALIPLPVRRFGRFVRLPDSDGKICLMYLDDVVRVCLPLVFRGMRFRSFDAYSFKFTKDAEMDLDTDLSNGFVQKISKGLKNRKKGEPIRILYDAEMPKEALEELLSKLNVGKSDSVMPSGRYQNHKDLMGFPDCGRGGLRYPAWPPIRKRDFDVESLLDAIREKDRFLHVPYHSFDAYVRLLREAAIRPDVKSVKTTLYRLAKDSQVIQALVCAARNGKKVTVCIELLARFDEASNIDWSRKMTEAGIRVIFGVPGLKVHCKITHIGLEGGDVAVISTGNFHEGNARRYTDFLMMTARPNLVREVDGVFDFIERPYRPVKFHELIVSPNDMRKKILRLMDREIENRRAGKDAHIFGKINHIVDAEIVEKLYEAAAAGVRVEMLVRGNSSLVTTENSKRGENIGLVGIIDRYLEHSRIFFFANGGDERCYIGSADWMPRNFDRRIEVLSPVYDADLKRELKRIVAFGLKDSAQGRIVDGSGRNLPVPGRKFRSQAALYAAYQKENV